MEFVSALRCRGSRPPRLVAPTEDEIDFISANSVSLDVNGRTNASCLLDVLPRVVDEESVSLGESGDQVRLDEVVTT